jgi:hypothetical protein
LDDGIVRSKWMRFFFHISSSFLPLVINHPLARFELSSVPLCTHKARGSFVVYFLSLSLRMIFIPSQLQMIDNLCGFFPHIMRILYSCMMVSMDDKVTWSKHMRVFLKLCCHVPFFLTLSIIIF